MNKIIAAVFLLLILVTLTACELQQLADSGLQPALVETAAVVDTSPSQPVDSETAEPATANRSEPQSPYTPEPLPTYTPEPAATPEPTFTPSPTPTPTATSTPSPTPPSPEAILDLALFIQEKAESYQFEISRKSTVAEVELGDAISGDFMQPDLVSGHAKNWAGDLGGEKILVKFGEKVYQSFPGTDEVSYQLVEPGELGWPGLIDLWHQRHPPDSLTSLELAGIEEVDGRSLYQITGALPGDFRGPNVEGDILAELQVGVEDGYIYEYTLTYTVTGPGGFTITENYSFANFNQPVQIDIPEINLEGVEQIDEDLGISYELPADWTIEKSGDESCDQGECPKIRLFRDRPGGPRSEIAITGTSPASVWYLREAVSGREYEDTQAGSIVARWREEEETVDGLLYPQPNKVLQLSAQWDGHPEQEDIVHQIIGSLHSKTPPAPEGYRTHELPGWAFLDIPEDWHVIDISTPGVLEISSDKVSSLDDLDLSDSFLQLFDIVDEGLLPIDLLRDRILPSLEYDWEMVDEPHALTIHDQKAATVTYLSDSIFMEQVTIIQSLDGTHTIQLLSSAGEVRWPQYETNFETIRDSIRVYPLTDNPEIWPGRELPDGYKRHIDDAEGFEAAYPSSWQFEDAAGTLTLSPPETVEVADSESKVGSVIIYPPSVQFGDDEPTEEGLALAGQMDALWQWAGSPAILDTMMSSEGINSRRLGKNHAAAYIVATDQAHEGRPIYGFMGIVTDGDSAVKMLSWFDDPYSYRKQWLDIFDSIRITTVPNLDWESAMPLTSGELLTGTLSSDEPQLFSFPASVGETFALLAHIDFPEDAGMVEGNNMMELIVFDQNHANLGYSLTVSPFSSQPFLFTPESSGEHIISVESFVFAGPSAFDLTLLPADEGEANVLENEIGFLDSDCREFGYLGVDSGRIAVFAQPIFNYSDDLGLSLEVLDNDRELLYEKTAYYKEDLPENYELEIFGDNQIYNFSGLPIVTEIEVPDDGFIIRVCEPDRQFLEYELIVLALPE